MQQYKYDKDNKKVLFNVENKDNYSFGFQQKLDNGFISYFKSNRSNFDSLENLNKDYLFKDFDSFFRDNLFFDDILKKNNKLINNNSFFF